MTSESSPRKLHQQGLVEFQKKILNEMNVSKTQQDDFVGVKLDSQYWLIDTGDIEVTSQISDVVNLGGLNKWVLGISNIKNHLVTLVNMPHLFKMKNESLLTSSIKNHWATVLHHRFGTHLALLWPALVGMLPRHELMPSEEKPRVFSKRVWKDKDGKSWQELDVEKLLATGQFEQVRTSGDKS